MRYAAASHVGNTRKENQDGVILGPTGSVGAHQVLLEGLLTVPPGGTLVAVVDGMGGHRGGRDAAGLIAHYLLGVDAALPGLAGMSDGGSTAPAPSDGARLTTSVGELLGACNSLIFHMMGQRPELRGMGAAIAGLACLPDAMVVFNIGDARVYQYSAGYLLQVSEDHRAPGGGLLQSLGGTDQPVPLAPTTTIHPADAGTRWLLCTDGLYDAVPFGTLQEALTHDSPRAIAIQLVAAALDNGATDNISLIVLDT